MFEFISWFKGASLDEILLMLFVVTGIGFIRVIMFTGKNIANATNAAISQLATKLDKLDNTFGTKINKIDETLNHMTQVMMDFKLEVHDEIAKMDRRAALNENDISHIKQELERRKEPRGQ